MWLGSPRVLLSLLAAVLCTSACASIRHVDGDDPDERLLGDVVAPPAPGERLAWSGSKDDEVWTEPGELPRLLAPDGNALPLRLTDVHADVRGHIADVVVTQRFVNDRKSPIEVVYVFPLPENSAVTDMRMVIGDRIIESEVHKREEAHRAYVEAREHGFTAALLEQERPNVFTQSVANIPAGAQIDVEIHYLQTLSFDAGMFEMVFPMVVGPRYTSGADRVPDASRISPPIVGHGMRAGDDIAIAVDILAGGRFHRVEAPTHEVEVRADDARLHVELANADELPNRDFVLRWRASAKEPRSTLFVGPPDERGEGHFELLVVPPTIDVDARIGRREFVFVLDVSGSMFGEPLALEKVLLRKAIARLRPVDTFNVVTFAVAPSQLFAQPQAANAARIEEALRFVDGLEAGGGTEMRGGVELALGGTIAAGRHRYVVFMTDGQIDGEAELFAAARQLVRRQAKANRVARVFTVGVGSSPNRHLIQGLARAGAGSSYWMSGREDPERTLAKLQHVVDAAILTEVELEWNGARVRELVPSKPPDLFASHLLVLHGRYRGAMPETGIELRARAGGREITLPVQVMTSRESDRVLARLWAREQIAELESQTWATGDPESRRRIEALGLQYHLVTPYTSLIAVDRTRVVEEPATTIVQPTHAPEDVDVEMAGGTPYGGNAVTGGGPQEFRRLIRVRTAPVQQRSAAGRQLDMQAYHNVPIGTSVSRDFTAVVASTGTASIDSAGISLAGTTGAESRYTVEGASVNNPRFGSLGTSIVQEFIDEVDVQESGYEAEFGGASGGRVAARRISGSNLFRGVARFSYTPRLAKPRFITGTDEALRVIEAPDYTMQGVLSMTGPLVRDRLFWSGGAAITGGRGSLIQSFHRRTGEGGETEKFAEHRLRQGGIDLQFMLGLDWWITPRHELELTVLSNPGFERRTYRRPRPDGRDVWSAGTEPLGGGTRIANGLANGQFGWDRDNSTSATLGYLGRVADDTLEIDARLSWFEGTTIDGWKLDRPEIRDQVATQQFDGDGSNLFELLDGADALDLVPGVAAACNDADVDGVACPVRQWLSGGMGQYGRSRTRSIGGLLSFTHWFNGAGAHKLKYGAEFEHQQSSEESRYSGRNDADYEGDTASRVDNHRFVFVDTDDPDARTAVGYGRVREEGGELRTMTTPLGTVARVDAWRARVSSQQYGFYLQDRWALLSNLFVSAGVRWEMQDVRDVFGRRGVLIWDNVAPRIGFSYDWTDEGRSRLSASYGWFYQPLPLQLSSRVFGGRVNTTRTYRNSDCVGERVEVGGELREKLVDGQPTEYCTDVDTGAGRLGGGAVVPRLKGQYNHQLQVGYEQEIVDDLVFGVRWLHTDLGRAVEDISTNGGLDFMLANPGVDVSDADIRQQTNRCSGLQSDLDTTDRDDPNRTGIARELARCRFLADAFEKVGSQFTKPRRKYDAFTFEIEKRFAKNWMVAASYTYSRLVGNYDGFVDPSSGPIALGASTQYDTPEMVRNSYGPLSYDTPHRFTIQGSYTLDFQSAGRLTLGSWLRFSSGFPISLRAGSPRYPGLFPIYAIPRGAGGRLAANYLWNLSIGYAHPLPADLELEIVIRWFNVTNARAALRVDEVYSTDNARPVAGGELSDVKHTKVQDSGNPGEFFGRAVLSPQGNFGVEAKFQLPTSAQFELALRF